jgi:hypothetical protein
MTKPTGQPAPISPPLLFSNLRHASVDESFRFGNATRIAARGEHLALTPPMIAVTRSVDHHAAQIRSSRKSFEQAAVAHNEALSVAMRLDAIHADLRSGTDLAIVLPSPQRR